MILQALLVSKDDLSAETLIQVLAEFGVAVDQSTTAEVAVAQLADARFDQVIVDFDDPEAAALVLAASRRLSGRDRNSPITVALLHDPSQTRSILGAGAHFILTKPIVAEQAQNAFRAATALLKCERQQSPRVAAQAAVTIRLANGNTMEGILLDLGDDGMEMLAVKPLSSGTMVHVSFALPDAVAGIEADAAVAWSSANGETGLCFRDMDAATKGKMSEWLAFRSHEALPREADAVTPCKLTDLSPGGCYAQTESPFPRYSAVDLCLRAAGLEVHTGGLVQVMHPGRGMGIEFPARTEAQRQSVTEFINFLTRQPDAIPQLESIPRSLMASAADLSDISNAEAGAEDPLLELLRKGNALEEEAFLAELHSQRTVATLG
ncbi:MAG: PilZ domain-containing protein [Terriglobales bacterium]